MDPKLMVVAIVPAITGVITFMLPSSTHLNEVFQLIGAAQIILSLFVFWASFR